MKKRVLLPIFTLFAILFGFVFSACDPNANISISLSTNNLEIVLGETQDNTASLRATIENGSDYTILVDYDSNDILVSQKDLGNNVTEIIVEAFKQCNVDVTLKVEHVSTTFTVNVVLPVSSVTTKQSKYSMSYSKENGGQFILSNSLFNFIPEGTNQTQLNFSIPEISGFSISDNVLNIAPNLNNLPSSIDVEVVSAFKDSAKTTLHLDILPELDTSLIQILDEAGGQAKTEYNIPRNNESSIILTLMVRVPFSMSDKQLNVVPKFLYNDAGITLNDSLTQTNNQMSCYEYIFNFTLDAPSKSGQAVDYLWFEIYYVEYPTISSNTSENKIKLTTYDEITGISCVVDGTQITDTDINIYTSYSNTNEGVPQGLGIRFEAIPTTANQGQLSLNVNPNDRNLIFLSVKNQSGSEVSFINGQFLFESGSTLYFMCKSGFDLDSTITLTIRSEENNEITKEITLHFNEGLKDYGFVYDNQRFELNRVYYLENNLDSMFSSQDIYFGFSPLNIQLETLKITTLGDVFEIVEDATEQGLLGGAKLCRLRVQAKQDAVGEGKITIKFESGQEISCSIVVISKIEDIEIGLDPTFNTSSAVGDITFNNNSIDYVAIKNGQSLPLRFNPSIETIQTTYQFADFVYVEGVDDVYDEQGAYNLFEQSIPSVDMFENTSQIISANYLKALSQLSAIRVGKVWVKASFTCKMLQLSESGYEYEYVDNIIEKYLLVEVYNPIITLTVSDRNIELYAYDEVGETNKNRSVKTIIIELNKGLVAPTYSKILFNGMEITQNQIFEFNSYDESVRYFTIEYLGDNQYKISALTRNDDGEDSIGFDEFTETSLEIYANDLNSDNNSFNRTLKIVMNKPILVNKIVTTNVSEFGIYLKSKSVSNVLSDNTFKILTQVYPLQALNTNLVYSFIPDENTNADIITISKDGVINVTGNYGGKGKIRIVPDDSIMAELNGNTYYRPGTENIMIDVDIIVADGTSRELAVRINRLDEINDDNLHYILMQNATISLEKPIFDTFNGGLYGKTEQEFVATINFVNSANLFKTLGLEGTIQDLVFTGTTTSNGMVVDVNNGYILNVNVDLQNQNEVYTVSSINSKQDNAGGIAEINYGKIENCTFAGSVSATQMVGGLVAINSGEILNSKVLIYNLAQGEMNLSADLVGGLVGEMKDDASLKNSFVYNYSQSNTLYSKTENFGAIVAKISSNNINIDQCFAEIGKINKFYVSKDENLQDDKNLIHDSYIISKDNDVITFTYFMTRLTGSVLSGSTSDNNFKFDSVAYGNRAVWNKNNNINYGFMYLNNTRAEQSLTKEQLESLAIQTSRLSLAQQNNEQEKLAVLFTYKTQETLTESEQYELISLNTLNVYELLGTTLTDGILISSSNPSIISTSQNSIYIKNTGIVTLTFMSKYDLTVQPLTVTVVVINKIDNFEITYNDENLNNAILGVKRNTSTQFNSSLSNSVVLVDRPINLIQNDFNVVFEQDGEPSKYIIGNKVGAHVVTATFEDVDSIELNIYLSLSVQNLSEEQQKLFNKILKENTLRNLTVVKTFTANSITLSANNVNLSLSDEITVVVTIDSDIVDDIVDYEVYDNNNKLIRDIFNISFDKTTNNKYITIYNAKIEVNKNSKDIVYNSQYVIRFLTSNKDIYSDLKIVIFEQEIIRVDINNYAQISSNLSTGTRYNYYPNNVLSPNTNGLLDIMVYPGYANFTHITVTSLPVNNYQLSFISMKKGDESGLNPNYYYVDSALNYRYIENGIHISIKDAGYDISRYFVRVSVPASVSIDTTFTINVTVYNGDEVMFVQPYQLIIVPQEKAGISVNGKNVIYALLGETLTADVVYEQTQTLKTWSVSNDAAIVSRNGNISSYGLNYLKETLTIEVLKLEKFSVFVETSRMINGVEEVVSSELLVYVINFELDFNSTTIANEQGNNIATGDKYFYHNLNFDIKARCTEEGQGAFEQFLENHYYNNNNDYEVNPQGKDKNSFIKNLYYVNGNVYTPVITEDGDGNNIQTYNDIIADFKVENNTIKFLGRNTGTQNMLLQVSANMPDGSVLTYQYFFTIRIDNYTDEDSPELINNATEFLAMQDGDTAQDYMLMQDIYLYDYEPMDTTLINSLDGNGYQIVIFSFAPIQETIANYALFNNVTNNTTLKNLIVNIYHIGEIKVSSSDVSTVNFAPIAINNSGIITNTQVISYKYRANEYNNAISGINITSDNTLGIRSVVSGFVQNNSGVITNSRVGGEKIDILNSITDNTQYSFTNRELNPFVISAFGELAGFVNNNTGHISSSYASNLRIVNNSNIDYTTITSGFVVTNSGSISMSYSKGVKNSITDIHATRFGIETAGISSGFVYSNAGQISNCYSNITLTNTRNNPGRTSSGFVYQNLADASIDTSMSYSRIIGSSTTQMNFAGVDERGNYLNLGNIENSYFYDQVAIEDSTIVVEEAYGLSAKLVESVTLNEYFYGFSFTTNTNNDDGIWYMTATGPDLVSPNHISHSLRYAKKVGDNDNDVKAEYIDDYKYGSKNNPILIRNAEEFNRVFSGTQSDSTKDYTDVENNLVFGSYRLVNDIDLSSLLSDENQNYRLSSSKMILTGEKQNLGNRLSEGRFDGNGFTIKGLALSDTSTNGVENFGLFSQITSNAIFMNVNIEIGTTNTEGEIFGIEAKNVTYVGTVAGTLSNSKVLNVSLKSMYEDTNDVAIVGKNVVGGVIGKVVGTSYVFNVSAENISVTAGKYPNDAIGNDNYHLSYNRYIRQNPQNDTNISYVGGLIGIFDSYSDSSYQNENYADAILSANENATMLKTKGNMILTGGTVGGVFGYVGPLTIVQDVLFELSNVNNQQKINSYNGFAGGIVGFNNGYLRQVRAEHESSWQKAIEDGEKISSYYKNREQVDRGHTDLFYAKDYNPIAVGGLVGLSKSGKIEKSYSKINVISNSMYAGGLIGLNERVNSEESVMTLNEVYAFGDVKANPVNSISSGAVGYSKSIYEAQKVNAVNYWGDHLVDQQYGGDIYNFTCFDAETNAQNITFIDCSAFKSADINFADAEKINFKEYVDSSETVINFDKVTSFENLIGQNVNDGENYDEIFIGNNWDGNTWLRNDDELFPHIIFGYYSNIVRIQKEEDFEKLRTNTSSNTIFVIDPDETINKSRDSYAITSDEKYIVVDRNFAPIVDFKGTLRGLDQNITYGIKFVTNQSRALFASTNNAIFSNFTILFNENSHIQSSLTQNSAFVINASNTTFNNITIKNAQLNINNSGNFGLLTANAENKIVFSNILFDGCQIKSDRELEQVNVGYLFANANLTSESLLSNINITQGVQGSKTIPSISLGDIKSNSETNNSNIGVFGGNLVCAGDESSNLILQDDENNIIDLSLDINIGNISTSVNVGAMFGQTNKLKISSTNKFSIKSTINISSASYGITSNIGGITGYGQNSTISNLQLQQSNIKVGDNKDIDNSNLNIGLVVGENDNSNCQGVIVDKNSKISVINVSKLYIGSIVGKFDKGEISNNVSFADIDITFANDGEQNYIGGFVGFLNGNLDNCVYYGNVIVKNSHNASANIGLGVGTLGDGTISNTFVFGDIRNNYNDSNISIDNSSTALSNTLRFSGLVAYVENSSSISNCGAFGNIYPSCDNGDKFIKSITGAISGTFTYGGLIGEVADGTVNIENNIILSTLFNKYDHKIVSSIYNADSVVGTVGKGSIKDVENSDKISTNMYCHVQNLTLSQYGQNKYWSDIKVDVENLLNEQKDLFKTENNFIEIDENEFNFIENTKINPQLFSSYIKNENETTQYYYLGNESSEINIQIGNLVNTILISDGTTINYIFTEGTAQDSQYISPISKIDENSYVAGLVVLMNSNIENSSNTVAGFVGENSGIVYSCNVRGYKNEKGVDIVGFINSTSKISGFVGENSGLISECYTALNLSSTFRDGFNIVVSGFALNNTGLIVNCYSSGTIQHCDMSSSELYAGQIYLFGPGQVENSYTNVKVIIPTNLEFQRNYNVFAFESYDSNKVDVIASEIRLNDYSYDNKAQNLTLGYYASEDKIKEIAKNYSSVFNIDQNYAYGYGSFTAGGYKNISYMHHNTGTGEENDPFQIPNFVKLQQIADNEVSTHYCLVEDFNCKDLLKSEDNKWSWKSLDIENIVLNGFDNSPNSGSHTIKNLNTTLFNSADSSIIYNINIENFTQTFEDCKEQNNYKGLLLNYTSGEGKTEIYNINVIEDKTFDLNFPINLSVETTFTFGTIVGKLGENATLTNCNLYTLNNTDNEFSIEINSHAYSSNLIIGGLVGELDGGVIDSAKMIKNLNIQFDSINNEMESSSYYIGGIVGKITKGQVTNSGMNAELNAFTDIEDSNTKLLNNPLYLYVGGIAGYIENTEEDVKANISNSYVEQNASIKAGNHYLFKETYAGGISGYGGYIQDCYNMGEVQSFAKYDVTKPEGINRLSKDVIFDNYFNFDYYIKLLFSHTIQKAYAGGISNNYNKLEKTINYSDKIYGGLDYYNLHSYYSLPSFEMTRTSYAFWVNIVSGLGLILDGSIVFGTISRAAGAAIMISGGVLLGIACGIANVTYKIDEYYFLGNGYGIKENYFQNYSGPGYNAIFKVIDELRLSLDKLYNFTKTNKINAIIPNDFAKNSEFNLPIFKAKMVDQNKNLLDVAKWDESNSWMSINKYSSDGIDYIYDESKLKVEDVYFDGIGYCKNNSAEKTDAYSIYQVFEEIDINGTTRYGFRDNTIESGKTAYDQYHVVYNKDSDQIDDLIDDLTRVTDVKEIITKDWEGWSTNNNGDYVLSNSPTVSIADLKEFLTNNIDINDSGDATINIKADTNNQNSSEDQYKLVVKLLNGLSDCIESDSETINEDKLNEFINTVYAYELSSNNKEKLKDLAIAINKGKITVNVCSDIVMSMSTEAINNFSGEFKGQYLNNTYPVINFNNGVASYNNESDCVAMISSINNATIKNINITMSNTLINENSKIISGLVGNVSGDNNNINKVNISFTYKDYNNVNVSMQSSTIGGLVGKVEENAILNVDNTTVSLSARINASELGANNNIAGFIGEIAQGSQVTLTAITLKNVDITTKSSNNIAGGIIGSVNNAKTVKIDNLNATGNIIIESSQDKVYVGGVIGKITSDSMLDCDNLQIELNKLSAGTNNSEATTYVGGIIGYITGATETNFTFDNVQIGKEQSNYTEKMFILSGIYGDEYPSASYSGDVFGGADNDSNKKSYEGITVYAKCLSLAKETTKDDLQSKLIYTYKNIGYRSNNNNKEYNQIFRIESYENDPHVITQNNAYINGEKFIIYNYNKEYIIYTIFGEKIDGQIGESGDSRSDTIYRFTENVYSVNIKGSMSEKGDFDIVETARMQLIKSFTYYVDGNIYGSLSEDQGIERNNYHPVLNDYKLLKITSEPQSIENGYIFDYNGNFEDIDIQDSINNVRNEDNNQIAIINETIAQFESKSSVSESGIMSITTTDYTYDTLTLTTDSDGSIKLQLAYTKTEETESDSTTSTTVQEDIFTYKNIYKYNSEDISKQDWAFEEIYVDDKNAFSEYTRSDLYMELNNPERTKAYFETVDEISTKITGINLYKGNNAFTIHNKTYTPIIISTYLKNVRNNEYEYKDYILLKDYSNKYYYLGYIMYTLDAEIGNAEFYEGSLTNRNKLFFPETNSEDIIIYVNYENHLLGLNNIEEITKDKAEDNLFVKDFNFTYQTNNTYNEFVVSKTEDNTFAFFARTINEKIDHTITVKLDFNKENIFEFEHTSQSIDDNLNQTNWTKYADNSIVINHNKEYDISITESHIKSDDQDTENEYYVLEKTTSDNTVSYRFEYKEDNLLNVYESNELKYIFDKDGNNIYYHDVMFNETKMANYYVNNKEGKTYINLFANDEQYNEKEIVLNGIFDVGIEDGNIIVTNSDGSVKYIFKYENNKYVLYQIYYRQEGVDVVETYTDSTATIQATINGHAVTGACDIQKDVDVNSLNLTGEESDYLTKVVMLNEANNSQAKLYELQRSQNNEKLILFDENGKYVFKYSVVENGIETVQVYLHNQENQENIKEDSILNVYYIKDGFYKKVETEKLISDIVSNMQSKITAVTLNNVDNVLTCVQINFGNANIQIDVETGYLYQGSISETKQNSIDATITETVTKYIFKLNNNSYWKIKFANNVIINVYNDAEINNIIPFDDNENLLFIGSEYYTTSGVKLENVTINEEEINNQTSFGITIEQGILYNISCDYNGQEISKVILIRKVPTTIPEKVNFDATFDVTTNTYELDEGTGEVIEKEVTYHVASVERQYNLENNVLTIKDLFKDSEGNELFSCEYHFNDFNKTSIIINIKPDESQSDNTKIYDFSVENNENWDNFNKFYAKQYENSLLDLVLGTITNS